MRAGARIERLERGAGVLSAETLRSKPPGKLTDAELAFVIADDARKWVAAARADRASGASLEQIRQVIEGWPKPEPEPGPRGKLLAECAVDAASAVADAVIAELEHDTFNPDRWMAAFHASGDRVVAERRALEEAEWQAWLRRNQPKH